MDQTAILACAPAEVGRSSSSVSTRRTSWCARGAVGRCGSSRSSSTTTSWMRSCGTSRRPRRGLLAAHRAPHLSPPLPELPAVAACAGFARGGGSETCDRGSGGAVKGNACWSLAAFNPGSRWKRANAHWSPKPYRDNVLAWSRKKGNSYPSVVSTDSA